MTAHSYTRRDIMTFVVCLGLAVVALFLPGDWGQKISSALRQSVLAPVVWLQEQAEQGKTSRARFQAVVAERDSLAYVTQSLPALRLENEQLRHLLELGRRVTSPYVAAEVLHQMQATDGRALLLSAGSRDGVSSFAPVIASKGLIGMVLGVAPNSSAAMTWAHPEFRVSAFTAEGGASGIVAPSTADDGMLEFRGVPYRDSIPNGALVLSSGLGGVYPKGIPIGTVTGIIREQAGWERVYRVQPVADPGSASHVLILTGASRGDVAAAFVEDSVVTAVADSLARPDTAKLTRPDTAKAAP